MFRGSIEKYVFLVITPATKAHDPVSKGLGLEVQGSIKGQQGSCN